MAAGATRGSAPRRSAGAGDRPFHAGHGWLAAVVPFEAERFRVLDADLAHSLASAGAQLVDRDPDVEIGPVEALSGDAPIAITNLEIGLADMQSRVFQVAKRVRTHAVVRRNAERARQALRRRGYPFVTLLPWDRDQVLRLPELAPSTRVSLAERFPCRVAVVGSRRPRGETAFERAVSEAAIVVGCRLRPTWPLPRASGLVALCDESVLRVAIGPGGRQIEAQTHALQTLAASSPPDLVAFRVPRLLGDGKVGLTRWSLEARLPGLPAPHSLDGPLLASCLEFLAALHGLGDGDHISRGLEQAQIVQRVLPRDQEQRLTELARDVDEALDDLPRGLGHGDFCTSNLLVHDGQLAGVVDWEAASRSAPPLLDLLHLSLLAARRPNIYQWGRAIVDYLYPLAQHGGDPVTRAYLERLGVDADPPRLEALVAAYWLARTSYQLGMYLDRARDSAWIEQNVSRVLETLAAS